MAVIISNIIPRKQAAINFQTQYTSSGVITVIDKFTITNTDSNYHVMSVYLVASGGAASSSNVVLYNKYIAPLETYTCPELIGQVLENNGFIHTYADAGSVLTISASGRKIS